MMKQLQIKNLDATDGDTIPTTESLIVKNMRDRQSTMDSNQIEKRHTLMSSVLESETKQSQESIYQESQQNPLLTSGHLASTSPSLYFKGDVRTLIRAHKKQMNRMARQPTDKYCASIDSSMLAIKDALPKLAQINEKLNRSTEQMGQTFQQRFRTSPDHLDQTVISINKFLCRKINQQEQLIFRRAGTIGASSPLSFFNDYAQPSPLLDRLNKVKSQFLQEESQQDEQVLRGLFDEKNSGQIRLRDKLKARSQLRQSFKKTASELPKQSESEAYLIFRDSMRRQTEQQKIQIEGKPMKDQNKLEKFNEDDQFQTQNKKDQIEFFRLQKKKIINLLGVAALDPFQRVEEERFYLRMHLKLYAPFFMGFDNIALSNICKYLVSKQFDVGQVIMRKGDDANEMFLILQGEVGIFFDDDMQHCVVKLNVNQTFGERALQTQENRVAHVVALQPTFCLVLSRDQYKQSIFHIENLQSHIRLKFMMNHSFLSGWDIEQIKSFNKVMGHSKYSPGDIIYELGQAPDVIYFIKTGSVQMSSKIQIEQKVQFPTSTCTWEIKTTKLLVDFEVRKFQENEIIGHQEIIEQVLQDQREIQFPNEPKQPAVKRRCTVRTLEHTEMYYVNRDFFNDFFANADIRAMADKLYCYDDAKVASKILRLIKEQKLTNKAILDSCKDNISAQFGEHDQSKIDRQKKLNKSLRWIQKSQTKPTEKNDMPKIQGVEKIKIVKISQISHEKVKNRNGDITITRKEMKKN